MISLEDELAERFLAECREHFASIEANAKLTPKPEPVRVLLRANDRLRELIQNPGTSNQADVTEIRVALAGLHADRSPSAGMYRASSVGDVRQSGKDLRVLLVEDDYASRLLLEAFLSRYGVCHIAVNGRQGP